MVELVHHVPHSDPFVLPPLHEKLAAPEPNITSSFLDKIGLLTSMLQTPVTQVRVTICLKAKYHNPCHHDRPFRTSNKKLVASRI